MTYAQKFSEALREGVFDPLPCVPNLRRLERGMIRYPVVIEDPVAAFGGPDRLSLAFYAYRESAGGYLLNTSRPVCVEGASSAVFLQNRDPETISVASFGLLEGIRILLVGDMSFSWRDPHQGDYLIERFHPIHIEGSRLRPLDGIRQEAGEKLFKDALGALDQIVYLSQKPN